MSDNESVGNRSVRSNTSHRSWHNRRQSEAFKVSDRERELPVNIVGWHGVYVCGLDAGISEETVRSVFSKFGKVYLCEVERRGRKAAAVIHYDNPLSPAKAIHRFLGVNEKRLSYNDMRLVLRFKNGHNQGDEHLIEIGKAATRRWTSRECFHWRTNGCDSTIRKCTKLHKPMCRGIDFQPYMLNVKKV